MDTTSTMLITNSVSSTVGLFSVVGTPLLYLILALFFALFGIGVFWNQLVNGVRRVVRAIGVRM